MMMVKGGCAILARFFFHNRFMPLSLQKFREIVFHLLYSSDFGGGAEAEIVPLIMQQLTVTKSAVREARVIADRF